MSQFKWKDQYVVIGGQSSHHVKMQNIFQTETPFKNYKCFQEVPVSDLVPSYHNGRERFDWYVRELHLIIEIHGEQHYSPVTFGGMSEDQADYNFRRQKKADKEKKRAIIDAGYFYLEISYKEMKKLDVNSLVGMISSVM